VLKIASLVAYLAVGFCQGNRSTFAALALLHPPILDRVQPRNRRLLLPIPARIRNLCAVRERGKAQDAQVKPTSASEEGNGVGSGTSQENNANQ
jgi:hypothetical protein